MKTKQRNLIIGLCILLLLPITFGASLTDSLINSTESNTTINVTGPIYFDTLTVANGGIYFEKLRASAAATESLTFNITEQNVSYFDEDLPNITDSGTSKIIFSNLNNSVTASLALDLTSCNPLYLSALYPDGTTDNVAFSCTTPSIVSSMTVQKGITILSLVELTKVIKKDGVNAMSVFASFIPTIVIILIAFLLLAIIIYKGFNSESGFDMQGIVTGIIIVVVTVIIIVIGIQILNSLG